MPAYIDKMHVLMMALMMRGVASAGGSAGSRAPGGQAEWAKNTAPDKSEARTVLPLNSQYFVLFREFSRRHLAPSNAVLVASPGPWFSAAGRALRCVDLANFK